MSKTPTHSSDIYFNRFSSKVARNSTYYCNTISKLTKLSHDYWMSKTPTHSPNIYFNLFLVNFLHIIAILFRC